MPEPSILKLYIHGYLKHQLVH